jgi:hypothetical protein
MHVTMLADICAWLLIVANGNERHALENEWILSKKKKGIYPICEENPFSMLSNISVWLLIVDDDDEPLNLDLHTLIVSSCRLIMSHYVTHHIHLLQKDTVHFHLCSICLQCHEVMALQSNEYQQVPAEA